MAQAARILEKTVDRPAPGEWQIDLAHSSAEFVARHLVFTKVRGRFEDWAATIHIAENLEDSWAEATLQAASVNTQDAGRDEHLRSADFFDAANHPTIAFKSSSISSVKGERWEVVGDLTIRGVTRPVTLDVEFNGVATDPWGNEKVSFSAETTVNREDFGLTWNQALETGGVLVGKEVRLELEVQASRKK